MIYAPPRHLSAARASAPLPSARAVLPRTHETMTIFRGALFLAGAHERAGARRGPRLAESGYVHSSDDSFHTRHITSQLTADNLDGMIA